MTLGEFKKATKDMPDHLELFVAERKTEFSFGMVNSVFIKKINFMEDPNGPVLSKSEVIVLDEE